MNKRLKILFLFFCILLTGCTNKEPVNKLSKEDQSLTLTVKKEKKFGNFDYLEIDKKEAEKLMKEKFELPIPSFFSDAVAIIDRTFKTEEITTVESTYAIVSQGESLSYSILLSYKDANDKYLSYATIELQYKFLESKKEAFLQKQEVLLYNSTEEEKFHGNDLTGCLRSFSQLMNTDKKAIENEALEKIATKQKDSKVYLLNTMEKSEKNKAVGRSLIVEYSDGGTPNKLSIITRDFSK